ncbi:MAG: nucleoside-diphosphate kinase [Candidatus Sumerlaeia bacterium]|nr:nucleoside-diphosphate kinase [Candidatus Sumerlaeia bacterium]
MEQTFIMLKPDAVTRGLVGEIIQRLERKGLQIIALKLIKMNRVQAEQLYAEHKGKEFYERLLNFVTDKPVVVMVVRGKNAIQNVRNLMGATEPAQAQPGSIRGDLATSMPDNLIHGTDSPAKAEREIKIFFTEGELV